MTSRDLAGDPLHPGGLDHGDLGLVRNGVVLEGVNVGDPVAEGLGVPARFGAGTRERDQSLTERGLGGRVGKVRFYIVEKGWLGVIAFQKIVFLLFGDNYQTHLNEPWPRARQSERERTGYVHRCTCEGADVHQRNR